MRHSLCLFKKIVFVFCFFVCPSLSAMPSDTNKRINEQSNSDINFYSSLTAAYNSNLSAGCSFTSVNTTCIERCWGLFPKAVMVSRDTSTNHFNLIYDGEVKASDEDINVAFDKIMGTHDVYLGQSLIIENTFNLDQILQAMKDLQYEAIFQMMDFLQASSAAK